MLAAAESQLAVLGREATRGSTPKAILFEPTRFRNFFATPLLTESCGEGVAFGLTETEKDSNSAAWSSSYPESYHRPHDTQHVADQPGL
ncbi:MAG: hypothetical protein CMM01_05890 [Rhodopirellula sp.]|nr:hypothetical protein [Rhodopirellula sp.]